mmetsp:Transcript_3638/g.7323  ORF Transcript_3638/g.7323 Transcript_3638/m.7323 type:complete len:244 (-) Transcript_3638:142-873(-)
MAWTRYPLAAARPAWPRREPVPCSWAAMVAAVSLVDSHLTSSWAPSVSCSFGGSLSHTYITTSTPSSVSLLASSSRSSWDESAPSSCSFGGALVRATTSTPASLFLLASSSRLAPSVSLLDSTSNWECATLSALSISRELGSTIALGLCRAAYVKAGKRYVDSWFRDECEQHFDEVFGLGEQMMQLLDAPLMTRKHCILQMAKDEPLTPLANELLYLLCQAMSPLMPEFCRSAHVTAVEMSNT